MSDYYRAHGAWTEPGRFASMLAAPVDLANLCAFIQGVVTDLPRHAVHAPPAPSGMPVDKRSWASLDMGNGSKLDAHFCAEKSSPLPVLGARACDGAVWLDGRPSLFGSSRQTFVAIHASANAHLLRHGEGGGAGRVAGMR